MAQPIRLINAEEARIREAYRHREQNDSRYSWFNPAHQFMIQQCERRILASLNRYGFANLQSKTILEVGCGNGHWLNQFVKWGARPENVNGIDLLADRLANARRSSSPAVGLQCASAAELPFRSGSFDIVFQSTVFTSILDLTLKQRAASEMLRVLDRGGLILWYDYHVNNPWNRDVRGVKRQEIAHLFPNCRIELHRVTLIPQLARLIAPYSYFACYVLEKLPPLCTHYLGVIRKV